VEITKEWLEGKSACSGGLEWFLRQQETNGIKIVKKLIPKHSEWANWLVVRLMTHTQQVEYAIYAAEQVIGIFEKEYPEDERPRKAIGAAKAYLKTPTTDATDAIEAAGYATEAAGYATEAARAARAAGYAAWAAWAAEDAAWAAWAARYAARAVWAAEDAAGAARAAMKKKLILYGVNLLGETKKGGKG
jgi:hypothetical protein